MKIEHIGIATHTLDDALRFWRDALALEVAECPNLIKGYGDTHILGTRNFESLMEALLRLRRMPGAAANLKTLREAALADDTGQKLSRTLKEIV